MPAVVTLTYTQHPTQSPNDLTLQTLPTGQRLLGGSSPTHPNHIVVHQPLPFPYLALPSLPDSNRPPSGGSSRPRSPATPPPAAAAAADADSAAGNDDEFPEVRDSTPPNVVPDDAEPSQTQPEVAAEAAAEPAEPEKKQEEEPAPQPEPEPEPEPEGAYVGVLWKRFARIATAEGAPTQFLSAAPFLPAHPW